MEKLKCVLLIDDDGITNFLNQRLLKKLSISEQVHTSVNGKEGLKFIENYAASNGNYAPDVILLDLNMPVFDGFEFLEAFRKTGYENKAEARIIILTTSTHQKDINKIVDDKNVGYINKPLTEEKLLAALSKGNNVVEENNTSLEEKK
ncbi:MAG: response regulator [Cytophagaceae bacterium]